ncbi:hypothetical protein F7R91_06730 [Streptomyces luteolifulvus]|jgi:hypothetical protein|uniref:Large ribosomal subunit protein bL12 C-terminal domain-containing protein n=1 Tax=Streptomyces luteolifulvus TaxID=2615112 RepID=A0A6H9V3Q8_9ACTN|nr:MULTISPECIES: hypothetical protein [Streptomyces]KAB1149435.1 hypothetical protein F7R91_06730 [Streptomyces luteolifulvus]MXM64959.1 hypothetical protein [Streptomyces sp. HUCO-GS316]
MDILAAFVGLAVLVGIVGLDSRISRVKRQADRVERKLDLVLDHLGLSLQYPRMDEVAALARDGRTIEAVKMYREVTGAGLKEAKEAVDKLG